MTASFPAACAGLKKSHNLGTADLPTGGDDVRVILLLLASLWVLVGCAHRIPRERIPEELPPPTLLKPEPLSVPWSGDPSAAYEIILRGLVSRQYEITFADPHARVVRAERVGIDPYLTNRLQRKLIEAWNDADPWYQAGMEQAGGVWMTVSRRVIVSAVVEPSTVVISLAVESRTNRPNKPAEAWSPDDHVSEDEAAAALAIAADLRATTEKERPSADALQPRRP